MSFIKTLDNNNPDDRLVEAEVDIDDLFDRAHLSGESSFSNVLGGTSTSLDLITANDIRFPATGAGQQPQIHTSTGLQSGVRLNANTSVSLDISNSSILSVGASSVDIIQPTDINVSSTSALDVNNAGASSLLVDTTNDRVEAGSLQYNNRWSARMTSTATQSIPHNAVTTITFDTETFDTSDSSNMVDLTNETITIKKAGVYLINFTAGWADNTAGLRRAVFVDIGGSTTFQDERYYNGSGTFDFHTISAIINLAVDDVITMKVFQTTSNSSSSLLGGTTAFAKRFSVMYMGDV